jgi:hypothetical protein
VKEKKEMVIKIFHRNMGSLLSKDIMTFLPGSIGGYDCPHLIPNADLWKRAEDELPNVFFPLFQFLTEEKRKPIWLSLLMRRARTGISSRGIENPTLDPLIQSYEFALTECAQVKYKTWHELHAMTVVHFNEQGRDPNLIIGADVRRTAKKLDLINGFDLADIVDRSSALRIFFLVALDLIPLQLAVPGRGSLKSPSEIFEDFAENELSERIKFDYLTKIADSFTVDASIKGFNAFKKWFQGGMEEINTDFGNNYLARSSYTDSLNGMYIPIWETRSDDEPYVKGSYKDPFRDLDQDLFIGRVVTLDRVG